MIDSRFETGVAILGSVEGTVMPIDEKIVKGIALFSSIVKPETLQQASARLDSLFDVHDTDLSEEAGDCIAYGVGLGEGEVSLLEESLLCAAASRNHGMQELDRAEIGDAAFGLWLGQTATRQFTLHRFNGPIVLTNGQFPIGNVYSLLSKPL